MSLEETLRFTAKCCCREAAACLP